VESTLQIQWMPESKKSNMGLRTEAPLGTGLALPWPKLARFESAAAAKAVIVHRNTPSSQWASEHERSNFLVAAMDQASKRRTEKDQRYGTGLDSDQSRVSTRVAIQHGIGSNR
jgi:hypothetical protein